MGYSFYENLLDIAFIDMQFTKNCVTSHRQ